MSSEQAEKRFYELKFGDEANVAILPGENPLDFELLHTKLAGGLTPDGVLRRVCCPCDRNMHVARRRFISGLCYLVLPAGTLEH